MLHPKGKGGRGAGGVKWLPWTAVSCFGCMKMGKGENSPDETNEKFNLLKFAFPHQFVSVLFLHKSQLRAHAAYA